MSDNATQTPNPLALGFVNGYGPRAALLRATASVNAERAAYRAACDGYMALVQSSYSGRPETQDLVRDAQASMDYSRGRLLGAVDQLVNVAEIVAFQLPEVTA